MLKSIIISLILLSLLFSLVSASLIYSYVEQEIIIINSTITPAPSYFNATLGRIDSTKKVIITKTVSKVILVEDKAIGYSDGKITITGYLANQENNLISVWTVPQGDRNLEEFGRCRPYEIEKGVCQEIEVIN